MIYKTFLLLALSGLSLFSQTAGEDAWEPGEGKINLLRPQEVVRAPSSLPDMILLPAISLYRSSLSGRSVSRCPFEISCSRFASMAIERHGFLGYLIFMDRYFYRENAAAFSLYTRKSTPNNTIKLDDKIFLDIFK
jgi:hypothetical protein